MRGDLIDPAACTERLPALIRCFTAAKVAWGRWGEFQTGCLDATETLARAALRARSGPLCSCQLDQSYGHPAAAGPDQSTAPLGENVWILDYYTRSKVLCELLLWKIAERRNTLDGDPPELALRRAIARQRRVSFKSSDADG